MITCKRTRRGWLLERSAYSPGYRANVQGAVDGYRAHYSAATLARVGIALDADPDASHDCNDPSITHAQYLAECVGPDRVLARGSYCR